MIKRLFALFFLFSIMVSYMPVCIHADNEMPDTENAANIYMCNIESNTVIFEKNSDSRIYPASTVKIMTAIIALEHLGGSLDDVYTIPSSVTKASSGVTMELKTGENISYRALFYGLIVGGANDAAIALATASSGSIDNFILEMNAKARELGMSGTHYANVTGTDDDNGYTTAKDTAMISIYAFKNNTYTSMAQIKKQVLEATDKHSQRTVHTRNHLLSKAIYPDYYYNKATGLNAGSTEKAGYCISATANVNNLNYLCVVMGAKETDKKFNSFIIAKNLIDWASKNYGFRTVLDNSRVLGEINVNLATGADYVSVIPAGKVEAFLPLDTDIESSIQIKTEFSCDELTAPVAEGDVVGTATVLMNGKVIGETKLVTKSSLNLSKWLYFYSKLQDFIKQKTFKLVLTGFILMCIISVLITARVRYKSKAKITVRVRHR